ncbi:MAG: TonB-dependent receptor [Pseudomonadales bacterium]|jgi:outer membrane receptor protein involved in Fe transport|nr:TonB-dependent receptor [Pseudomonadales bacterium]
MKTHQLRRFARSSLALSIITACAAPPLLAQQQITQQQQIAQQQIAQQNTPDIDEVMITGSRIRQTSGMLTPVPVTAITTAELQEYRPDATIADQLDQLPQFFQTQSAQRGGVISGSSGASAVNMRGLGGNRTLVLLNGSRVVANDRSNQVNVDVFPTALISNIEVVTGGASAAYGADALAGVVNFILNREFEGLKMAASTGITEVGDGQNWSASIAGGDRFGERLHLIGSIEGRRIHQIDRQMSAQSGQWDSFQRWGHVTNPAWNPADPPGTNPQRLTLPYVHSTAHSPTGLINMPGSKLDRMTFLPDGSDVRPFVLGNVASVSGAGSTQSQSGGPEALIADLSFNAGPFGNEVRQESVFGGFKFDLTERLDLHGDLILSHTESNSYNQRGVPHLQTPWQATIYAENPFIPESVRQVMQQENLGTLRVEKLGQPLGITDFDSNESQHNRFAMWTANLGFDFDFNGNWKLGGSYQHGETDRTTIIYNEVRVDRLFMAIDAVRDTKGGIICNVQRVNPTSAQLAAAVAGQTFAGQQRDPITRISPVGMDNAIRDCQPINIFGYGNNSQAAINYVADDRIGLGHVQQDFAELVLDGELFKGFGAGAVSMATGLTWRQSSFWQHFATNGSDPLDGPALNAPALGIRGIPAGYAQQSTTMYMFGSVPVIDGKFDVWEMFGEVNVPIFELAGGQRLNLNLAARSSDYSRSGRILSWKSGLSFQALEGLRLRGTVSRDVREASFSELFDQQGTAGQINDPALSGTTYQITMVNGGNPSLSPEEADTITAGAVFQPAFGNALDGLQVSLDWYSIQVAGLVGQLGQQRIVDECFAGNTNQCQYVLRDASTGMVNTVRNVFQNINAAKVSGVDMELVYTMEPNFFANEKENLSIRALTGYLRENSQTNLGGTKLNQAGAGARPTWTTTISGTYTLGAWDLLLRARYFDSVLLNASWVEGVDVDSNVTASSTTWNLGLGYAGKTNAGLTWRANLNVTNLFNREPPIIPSFNSRFGTQTVSNDYDVFGRRYQVSLNLNF